MARRKKFSGREDVFLADEFIEGARAHPGGEGSGGADGLFRSARRAV